MWGFLSDARTTCMRSFISTLVDPMELGGFFLSTNVRNTLDIYHSGGFRGAGGVLPARVSPMDQNFFNFMGFFRKCINILGRRPPRGLAPPPTTSPGSAPVSKTNLTKPESQKLQINPNLNNKCKQ